MPDEIAIRLTFTYDDPTWGTLTDALYFTQDEFAKMSQTDIDAAKQVRIDAFIANQKNPPPPPPPPPPTLDDIAAQLSDLITTLQATQTDVVAVAQASVQPLPPIPSPPVT